MVNADTAASAYVAENLRAVPADAALARRNAALALVLRGC
jgi:hypothetical protein